MSGNKNLLISSGNVKAIATTYLISAPKMEPNSNGKKVGNFELGVCGFWFPSESDLARIPYSQLFRVDGAGDHFPLPGTRLTISLPHFLRSQFHGMSESRPHPTLRPIQTMERESMTVTIYSVNAFERAPAFDASTIDPTLRPRVKMDKIDPPNQKQSTGKALKKKREPKPDNPPPHTPQRIVPYNPDLPVVKPEDNSQMVEIGDVADTPKPSWGDVSDEDLAVRQAVDSLPSLTVVPTFPKKPEYFKVSGSSPLIPYINERPNHIAYHVSAAATKVVALPPFKALTWINVVEHSSTGVFFFFNTLDRGFVPTTQEFITGPVLISADLKLILAPFT